MKVTARCSARVDLAGGTLDLWPLYLLHPGSTTVNFALDLDAVAEAEDLEGTRVELISRDLDASVAVDRPGDLDPEGDLALLVRLALHLKPDGGVRLVTSSASPPGAGLGASSALAAAVVAALDRLEGRGREHRDMVHVARDCETQALGFPAGSQDYWPGLEGGALALHWGIEACRVESLPVPPLEVEERFALAYTGAPHHSGLSNWAVYKARLEGDPTVRRHLEGVRDAAQMLADAFRAGDWNGVADGLRREWDHRRRLGDGVSTPQIDALIRSCRQEGALAGKACGAGGGGCVVLLCEPGTKDRVQAVFASHDAKPIPVRLATGLRVEADD